ncbi:MAG: ribose ABC transporter permease [Actinobacteria bacterium]|nr:ribose ABC transporter permease [Actinomycetota bacterium]
MLEKINERKFNFSSLRRSNILTPSIALIFLVVLLSFLSPHFLTVSNMLNVLRQVSIIAIVSVGMTYAILTGGIDLSVGSVVALSGVITTMLLKNYSVNMYLSILAGLTVGILCGVAVGSMISSKIKMPPFIAGLAMMAVVRGIALIITNGRPIYNLPEQFGFIGGGFLYRIPFPVIIMIVIYIIAFINLRFTKMGVSFYAIGGNEEAARVAGINIRRSTVFAYTISGLTAAVAGIVLASRVMVGQPIAGYFYELDAIAASVIGGARMGGGEANIWGTLIGALIMGILKNGLNLLNVSTYYQQVAIGIVIAGTISFNLLRKS